MEEVRGHDSRRLGTQELTPTGTTPPGSRAEAVVPQNPGDGARGQAHPERAEFTLDAPIPPSRILPGQTQNECGCLVGCPGRTGKQATEDGGQGTIGGLVSPTPHMALEDCHLVAQGDQLDFLGLFGTKEQECQPEEVTGSQVDEGPQLPTCPVPPHRDEGSRADRSSAQSP
jgi:hypothetical protein